MAETTLVSQDDVEEIGSVLKLAPHARSSQFEVVTKNTDDEPLVSLDELYEKTGQESINKFLEGFRLLTEKNRLSRAHGQALNIQGSESWMVIPDQLNAVRGSEGFFTAIKDGIVTVVKAIIAFIAGCCNWIKERFARLFGFEKTVKEVEFLNEKTVAINSAMAELVEDMGGRGKGYKPEELFATLPKNLTDREQLTLIKNRVDSLATTIKRIEGSIPAFVEASEVIKKAGENANRANNNYRSAIDALKRKFKNKDVSQADIMRFQTETLTQTFVTLDYESMYSVMSLLYKEFYGIEIDDLGVSGTLNKARESLKNSTEIVNEKLSPEAVALVSEGARRLAGALNTKNAAGLSAENIKVGQKTFAKFSDMITLSDAEFIREVSEHLKAVTGVAELPAAYAEFCTKVREYTYMTEMLLKVVQECSKTYVNISQWYSRLSTMVATYVTGDIKRIVEANKAVMSPEEQERTMPGGKQLMPFEMEESFNQKYPGWNVPEDVSRLMRDLQEVEQVNKPLQKFIATMKG